MKATRERGVILSMFFFAILVILVSALMVVDVEAKTKTKVSIGKRVSNLRELCEAGGGDLIVVSDYEDDKLVQATTTCDGGSFDGDVCVNTPNEVDCSTAPRGEMPVATVVVDHIGVADPDPGHGVVVGPPEGGLPNSGIEVPDNGPPVDNNTVIDGPAVEAIDPTAGQPSSNPVIVGLPATDPNTVMNQNPIVILDVTPAPTPIP